MGRRPTRHRQAGAEPEGEPGESPRLPPSTDADTGAPEEDRAEAPHGAVDDVVLEAALAAIPPGLLAMLALGPTKKQHAPSAGRAGAAQLGNSRGRPIGVRRGEVGAAPRSANQPGLAPPIGSTLKLLRRRRDDGHFPWQRVPLSSGSTLTTRTTAVTICNVHTDTRLATPVVV